MTMISYLPSWPQVKVPVEYQSPRKKEYVNSPANTSNGAAYSSYTMVPTLPDEKGFLYLPNGWWVVLDKFGRYAKPQECADHKALVDLINQQIPAKYKNWSCYYIVPGPAMRRICLRQEPMRF